MFRPLENQKRINISSERLAMPAFPENYFMEGLETLLKIEKEWIPQTPGSSLYIRPFILLVVQVYTPRRLMNTNL